MDEMSIDTKKLTVATRAKITSHDRMTGTLVVQIDCIGFYNLKVDEKGKLKMTGMKLYLADHDFLRALSGPHPGM